MVELPSLLVPSFVSVARSLVATVDETHFVFFRVAAQVARRQTSQTRRSRLLSCTRCSARIRNAVARAATSKGQRCSCSQQRLKDCWLLALASGLSSFLCLPGSLSGCFFRAMAGGGRLENEARIRCQLHDLEYFCLPSSQRSTGCNCGHAFSILLSCTCCSANFATWNASACCPPLRG